MFSRQFKEFLTGTRRFRPPQSLSLSETRVLSFSLASSRERERERNKYSKGRRITMRKSSPSLERYITSRLASKYISSLLSFLLVYSHSYSSKIFTFENFKQHFQKLTWQFQSLNLDTRREFGLGNICQVQRGTHTLNSHVFFMKYFPS